MTSREITRALKGKTVAEVKLRPFKCNPKYNNDVSYDPVIIFSDGTRLVFSVEETEVGGYGVAPIVIGREDAIKSMGR